jgi:hypothetical protein
MILEHQLRIVGLAGVMIGTGLVAVHARACASQDATVVTIPVPVAVTGAPEVAATDTPTIPTVTMPCADSTTELLVDDHLPILCWGDRCLAYRDDSATSVPRPATHPSHPSESGAVVSADRVCTGVRCDRLGPKLRLAIAGVDPSALSATRDHAAIIIAGRTARFEVWNRATDRPISLGQPSVDEGEVVNVDVIGDRLIVARACNEYCSAIASVIDARGHRHGSRFATAPDWGGESARIVAIDADLFVAFGGFGELTMIAHGRSVATAGFLPPTSTAPHDVTVHAVSLGHDIIAAQWCTGTMCHLTRLYLGGTEPDSKRAYLDFQDDVPLPRCPG